MNEQIEGIRPGTMVRLKSGMGPQMMVADGHDPATVTTTSLVACYWFADGDVYQRADFREGDLEIVKASADQGHHYFVGGAPKPAGCGNCANWLVDNAPTPADGYAPCGAPAAPDARMRLPLGAAFQTHKDFWCGAHALLPKPVEQDRESRGIRVCHSVGDLRSELPTDR